jgi:hypothetical protein
LCGSVCFPLQGIFSSLSPLFSSHFLPIDPASFPITLSSHFPFRGFFASHFSQRPPPRPPTSPGIWSESDLPALASSFFPQCPVTDFTILLFDDMRATSSQLRSIPTASTLAPPVAIFLPISFLHSKNANNFMPRSLLYLLRPFYLPCIKESTANYVSSPPFPTIQSTSCLFLLPAVLVLPPQSQRSERPRPLVARIPLFLVAFPPPFLAV